MRVCMQGTCCHTSRIEQGCARGLKHALSKAAQGFKQALSSGRKTAKHQALLQLTTDAASHLQ